MKHFFPAGIAAVCLLSCSPRTFVLSPRHLARAVEHNPVFHNSFHGMCVYDLDSRQYLLRYNDGKYFTPASNTKLFTFYASLLLLPDTLPVLQYVARPDSLILWGTGNGVLGYDALNDTTALAWLRGRPEKLYFTASNFSDDVYGPGWAWEDYGDYYSPERASLPLFGNLVRYRAGAAGDPVVYPPRFAAMFRKDTTLPVPLRRMPDSNQWLYNPGRGKTEVASPYKTSPALTASLLGDLIGREVQVLSARPLPPPDTLRQAPGISADTVYRKMLQTSDNFLAEQLLLQCAGRLPEYQYSLRSQKAIRYLLDGPLRELPDPPKWVDGSGLSRYNLMTPRSLVVLLDKIYRRLTAADRKTGEERLFSLLPAAGKSGTLKNIAHYPPTVYAKTGSLSNNHNLSGYLVTRSGKRLCFSFMNNHFLTPVTAIQQEMGKILYELYLHY